MFDEFKPLSGATISPCGLYRYHLWRQWDNALPVMCFVMQNPSTADANVNDPTITRCIGFARREKFGGISVRNVFAFRATDERELLTAADPFGPENEANLLDCRGVSLMTQLIVAWGTPFGGKRLAHWYKLAESIVRLHEPECLGTTKDGHPRHPLFLRNDTPIVKWGSR